VLALSRSVKARARNRVRQRTRGVTDPVDSARVAGLRYVTDHAPGIRRRRAGKGFVYVGADARRVVESDTLRRIRALAIPPAWREVWICPLAHGHLQAVGRDARGRKQYRYHPRWRVVRDQTKYTRMIGFGRALPRIRARVAQDLARPGLPREKVLAAVVRLLDTTFLRVGNEAYARDNGSFGLTTLRNRHVDVSGATVRFEFHGKGGKLVNADVADRRVARIIRTCQELPGQELFQYVDEDGTRQTLDSADVNAYVREIADDDFTAKDFRTWAGTVLAALALRDGERGDSNAHIKRRVVRAVEQVARQLGNTPAICRNSYVHPAVIEAYLDGQVVRPWPRRKRPPRAEPSTGLRPEEAALLALLERRLEADTRTAA
jgi:DNA topoisomerase I